MRIALAVARVVMLSLLLYLGTSILQDRYQGEEQEQPQEHGSPFTAAQ